VTRLTINELLARCRASLRRLDPHEASAALAQGASLIDIRSEQQRQAGGSVPGALLVPRNALEWRLDPDSPHRDPGGPDLHQTVIVMCEEGYQSSLAAATLQTLGFAAATDLVGGFAAWRLAGLPVQAYSGQRD
jgi:rhodanese-related sulfurtransferase